MANVRDPAFWKRFSTAVHLDEEYASQPDLKHRFVYIQDSLMEALSLISLLFQ